MKKIEQISIDRLIDKTKIDKKEKEISQYSNFTFLPFIQGDNDKVGSLKLTRLDKCNDLQEANEIIGQLGDSAKRIYITCFSANETESIAMWGLYGKKPFNNRCRISFNNKSIAELVADNPNIFYDADMTQLLREEDYNISFRKIAYILPNTDGITYSIKIGKTSYTITKAELVGSSKSVELAGIIKSKAWEYEVERRIVVKLNKEISEESLYLQLNRDICDNLSIMAGPWNTDTTTYPKSKFYALVDNLFDAKCYDCKI